MGELGLLRMNCSILSSNRRFGTQSPLRSDAKYCRSGAAVPNALGAIAIVLLNGQAFQGERAMIRLARATKCQEQSPNRVGQVCFVRRRLKLGPIVRQPLSQAAPLQHGRKALHRRRPTLLRSLHRAISRRSYDQLGALKPVLVPARPRQPLHDLPPKWSAGGLADHDEILPLITAISWHS